MARYVRNVTTTGTEADDPGGGDPNTTDESSDRDPREAGESSDASESDGGDASTDAFGAEPAALLEAFRAAGATVVPCGDGRTDVEALAGADGEPAATADRGRRLYDRWSGRPRLYDGLMKLAAPMREDAFDALALESGEAVLDLACGPGTNFEGLRDGVGPNGTVVGLDYTPGMTRRAAEVVDERGWENVRVVRADAAETCGPNAAFDAVLTTFALHTMAEARAVVENVRAALRPGGRFVVLDARPITDGPARFVNPLYERITAWAVNHQRGLDTLPILEDTFERVTVAETYDAGAGYLAVAKKADGG